METLVDNLQEEQVEIREFQSVKKAQYSRPLTLAMRYDRFIEGLKFSHFAVMAMAVLIGSCLGSIAAMYLFVYGAPTWVFAIGLFASLANLVAAISQAPTKWMVNMFLLSVAVNLILICLSPVF
jgi:hypothetical protein